ncbi:MAG: right-handed parallel beta-helix repeat-containing protein, partial [Candidatus Thiodiazotropha sp.]
GAYGSSGFQYRLATTGDYQPSLRFPWLAAADETERLRWSYTVELAPGYHEYWVSADAAPGAGSGTDADPWNLYDALKKRDAISDNSIIWLKAGDYVSPIAESFANGEEIRAWPVTLQGSPGRAIHIRPEQDARVRIDGGLYFSWPYTGDHVSVWDLEMTALPDDAWRSFNPDYYIPGLRNTEIAASIAEAGEYLRAPMRIDGGDDIRLINNVIHALPNGIYTFHRASNSVVYGNIVVSNCFVSDRRSQGIGISSQNRSDTPRAIEENIIAGNFSDPFIANASGDSGESAISVTGNVFYGARLLSDGQGNFQQRATLRMGNSSGTLQSFTENMVYGQQPVTADLDPVNMVFSDNQVYYSDIRNCGACSGNRNITEHIPSQPRAAIRPNAYDPRKAHLMVVNPQRDPVVSIDLGRYAQNGDYLQIYNALDYRSAAQPLLAGTYNGQFIDLPMNGSSDPYWQDRPVTGTQPLNPADSADDFSTVKQEFGAFLIIRLAGQSVPEEEQPGSDNVTQIYPATLSHAIATPISSSVIADLSERNRWSSIVALQPGYHEFWVSANVVQSAGQGTETDPWNLFDALQMTSTIPDNSIIWLQEGDYVSPLFGSFEVGEETRFWPVRLQGSPGRAIHIRPEQGARVRIDSGLYFSWPMTSDHVYVWDLEMTALPTDSWRRFNPDYYIPGGEYGGDVTSEVYNEIAQSIVDAGEVQRAYMRIDGGNNIRLVNNIIHDLSMGIGTWRRAENNVLYGNIVYDNGMVSDVRPHGPGIYAQNESGTPRYLYENIVAGNFSNPFQLYSRSSGSTVLSSMYGKGQASLRSHERFWDIQVHQNRFDL